jgi:hypothetical protein
MRIETYEIICQLDVYKNLKPFAKILYSLLEKYNCTYGCSEWFYKSVAELAKISGTSKSTVSRSKQSLIYNGLIGIKKHYTLNGNRGNDYFHLNTLEEIYEHLQKDVANAKDINRLKPHISGSSLKPHMCESQ